MAKITKGVIACAGHGTRFLPATKAMPKEMLPIIDKPIVQYIVEEMVDAGITDIIFVTSWDKRPLEDHFDHSFELECHLKEQKKLDRLEKIEHIASMANFVYVRQKGPYGNGTPLLNVRSLLGDEPFIYAFGDDLVCSDTSFTKQLIATHEATGGASVIGAQEVDMEVVHKYGILELKKDTTDQEILGVIEKPSREEAPSNLANFGRYLLTPAIFDYLSPRSLGKDNELWLMDGIAAMVKDGHKAVAKAIEDGKWVTTGDPLSFLVTTMEYLKRRPDLKGAFAEYLKEQDWV